MTESPSEARTAPTAWPARLLDSSTGVARSAVLATVIGCLSLPCTVLPQEVGAQFATSVDLVRAHVRVTNASGQFITGLKAADFELRVDGLSRSIIDVLEMDLRPESDRYGPTARNADSPDESNAGHGSDVPRAARRRFMVFLDLTQAQHISWKHARAAASRFGESALRPGDLVGMVAYSPLSGLELLLPFTDEHDRFTSLIDQLSGGRAAEAVAGIGDGIPLEDIAGSAATADVAQLIKLMEKERFRAQMELFALSFVDLADMLAAVGGRKQVVLVSTGVPDAAFDGVEFRSALTLAARRLREADAVVHAVQPDTMRGWGVHDPARMTSGLDLQNISGSLRSSTAPRDFLNFVADETGGTNSWFRHNVARGIANIDEQTAQYYVLGFQRSSDAPASGDVEITIKRPNATVAWASTSIPRADSAVSRSDLQQALKFADALDISGDVNDFEMQIRTLPLYPQAALGGVAVVSDVPGGQIAKMLPPDHAELRFEVLGLAIAPSGAVIDYFDGRVVGGVPADAVEGRSANLRYYDTLVAPAGRYSVKIIVRETTLGLVASRTGFFDTTLANDGGLWASRPFPVSRRVTAVRGQGPRGASAPQRAGWVDSATFLVGASQWHPAADTASADPTYLLEIRNLLRHPFTGAYAPTVSASLLRDSEPAIALPEMTIMEQETLSNGVKLVVRLTLPDGIDRGTYELRFEVGDAISTVSTETRTSIIIISE